MAPRVAAARAPRLRPRGFGPTSRLDFGRVSDWTAPRSPSLASSAACPGLGPKPARHSSRAPGLHRRRLDRTELPRSIVDRTGPKPQLSRRPMEVGGVRLLSGTMRAERGQTAAEYLGACCWSARSSLVVLTAGTGTAVAGGIKHAICSILQQDDCDPAARRRSRRRRLRPRRPVAHRPPADRAPVPGLGHGHVHLRRAPTRRSASRTAGPACRCRPAARSRSSARRRRSTPTAALADPLAPAKLQLSANAEAKGAKAGGSLSGYLGQSTTFAVTVPPEQADDDRRRRPAAAEPGRPDHDQAGRERPAQRGLLRRHQRQGLLPRASSSRWATTRAPRVERRQAASARRPCG